MGIDRITQIVLLDFIKHYCFLYKYYVGHCPVVWDIFLETGSIPVSIVRDERNHFAGPTSLNLL
jgi:hypothetical protein